MESFKSKWFWIELLAVALNLLYTLLYLNSNSWCFLPGTLGPLVLLILCYRQKIYADALLQIVYAVLAIYGWLHASDVWANQVWSYQKHLAFLGLGVLLSLISWKVLRKFTDSPVPWLDSFTAAFAIVGTWLMVNMVHENWIYFMVINFTSVILYTQRKLYWGAMMYVVYFVMSADGYFSLGIFS